MNCRVNNAPRRSPRQRTKRTKKGADPTLAKPWALQTRGPRGRVSHFPKENGKKMETPAHSMAFCPEHTIVSPPT